MSTLQELDLGWPNDLHWVVSDYPLILSSVKTAERPKSMLHATSVVDGVVDDDSFRSLATLFLV